MKKLRIGNSNFEIKKDKRSTLESLYGVGRIRSTKILQFLLTNPLKKDFKKELVKFSQELKTQRIFKSIKNDNQLKQFVFGKLAKLARVGCYRAHRMLQNLPSKGQRTHTNAGTAHRLNPFVFLGVKLGLTNELIQNNYKWELNLNGRSTDLMEGNKNNKANKKKYNKAASIAAKKKKAEKQKKKK